MGDGQLRRGSTTNVDDPCRAWLDSTLERVDPLTVLAWAADRVRTRAAKGTPSGPDDVVAMAVAAEVMQAAQVLSLGRFEAEASYRAEGARSAVSWLATTADLPRGQVARLLSASRVVHVHEPFRTALAEGRTSVGHVAAMGRVATRERRELLHRDAEILAEKAGDLSVEDFEDVVPHWAGWADDALAGDEAAARYAKRQLGLSRTMGGWHLTGFLPTDDGELLRKLLAGLTDPPDKPENPHPRTAAQRRADALSKLIRRYASGRTRPSEQPATPGPATHDSNRASSAGSGNSDTDTDTDDTTTSSTTSSNPSDGPFGDPPPASQTGAPPPDRPPDPPPPDRPPTRLPGPMVTVDVRCDLIHLLPPGAPGQPIDPRLLDAAAHLPDLVPEGRAQLDRLLCDSWIGRALVAGPSLPLDLGRRTRTFTTAQRRAIAVAHPTCGMPWCDVPVDDCQVHHMSEWDRDHGSTDLANGFPLCDPDHHHGHDEGYRLVRHADCSVTVLDRHGQRIAGTPLNGPG